MEKVKTYSAYKKSGIAWIPIIPEHWEIVDTKRCFNFPKEIVGEDFINYKVLSLSVNGVIFRNMASGAGKHHSDMGTYQIIHPDSIVLCLFDMDVTPRIVGHSDKTGIITSAYINIKPKESINSKYYYYYFLLQDFNKYLFSQGTGIRTTLTRSQFGALKIALPSFEEQTAIARFLDYKLVKINRFIQKKKQLIKLLNEQKAAIINQAVTKGLNYDLNDSMNTMMNEKDQNQSPSKNQKNQSARRFKDSGIEWLGEIPAHWEVRKLKYVANCFPSNIDKHSKDDEKEVRLCNYTDVYKNDYITDAMDLMIASATDEQIEKFTLVQGDVIITKDSETANDIAVPAYVKEPLTNVVCGYHLSVLRPYEMLNGDFLFRVLQCKEINIQFEVQSNGVTRVGLGVYDLKNAKIPVPPLDEQSRIVDLINNETSIIYTTISKIEKELALTEEYKTALIAEAVTGKIDVRGYVKTMHALSPTEEIDEEMSIAAEEAEDYQVEEMQ